MRPRPHRRRRRPGGGEARQEPSHAGASKQHRSAAAKRRCSATAAPQAPALIHPYEEAFPRASLTAPLRSSLQHSVTLRRVSALLLPSLSADTPRRTGLAGAAALPRRQARQCALRARHAGGRGGTERRFARVPRALLRCVERAELTATLAATPDGSCRSELNHLPAHRSVVPLQQRHLSDVSGIVCGEAITPPPPQRIDPAPLCLLLPPRL